MRSIAFTLLFVAALLGASLYCYFNDMTALAIAAGVVILLVAGSALSSGSLLAHHREADAQRRNKEDLPLFYKDEEPRE